MNEFNEISGRVFEEFRRQAQKQGLSIDEIDEENGQIRVPNAEGQVMLIRLDNLIQYYQETGDKNAVRDFVAKIVVMAKPQEDPGWAEAKGSVYISLCPHNTKPENPLAQDATNYSRRYFILDTPTQAAWITPDMLEKWGISLEELERQALENGDSLLAETELEIGYVEGHPLGSFKVHDRTLNAALLLAPSLKSKVRKDFGWPIYAVIPNKVTCYFFSQEHYGYFRECMSNFVADKYEGLRGVSPELLELNDSGIRSVCSWMKRLGYVMEFDS